MQAAAALRLAMFTKRVCLRNMQNASAVAPGYRPTSSSSSTEVSISQDSKLSRNDRGKPNAAHPGFLSLDYYRWRYKYLSEAQGDHKSKKRLRDGKGKGKDDEIAAEEEQSELGDSAERKKSKRVSGMTSRR